jgi:unsaturated rhamnogalacturonyl hydrolase
LIRGQAASPGNQTIRAAACLLACVLLLHGEAGAGGKQALSRRVAQEAMERWPNGQIGSAKANVPWGFEPGILLAGFQALWSATKDDAYFAYIKQTIDRYVQPDGSIRTYDAKAYALNNVLMGRNLLMLYRVTADVRYRVAADHLHEQLATQPRTSSGGYWHAQATPNLMLLDDQFMDELAAVAEQLVLIYRHTRNPRTGLLYHGWDESRSAAGANETTGTSANH